MIRSPLAGVVRSVRNLDDFRPKPLLRFHKDLASTAKPAFTSSQSGSDYLTPKDGDTSTWYISSRWPWISRVVMPRAYRRQNLVVEAGASASPLGHQLRLKARRAIPRNLDLHRAEVALQPLRLARCGCCRCLGPPLRASHSPDAWSTPHATHAPMIAFVNCFNNPFSPAISSTVERPFNNSSISLRPHIRPIPEAGMQSCQAAIPSKIDVLNSRFSEAQLSRMRFRSTSGSRCSRLPSSFWRMATRVGPVGEWANLDVDERIAVVKRWRGATE
jgi:hypothetical protein